MELIVDPLPLVSLVIRLVVQGPKTLHFVEPPLPVIVTPILVVKFPLAVPHPVQLVTLILASDLEMLHHVLRRRCIAKTRFHLTVVLTDFDIQRKTVLVLFNTWGNLADLVVH